MHLPSFVWLRVLRCLAKYVTAIGSIVRAARTSFLHDNITHIYINISRSSIRLKAVSASSPKPCGIGGKEVRQGHLKVEFDQGQFTTDGVIYAATL